MNARNLRHEEPPVKLAKASYWSPQRLAKAETTLRRRVTLLREDIARKLRKYNDERLSIVAVNITSRAELTIADLLGKLYPAEIDRDVGVLRSVESALQRIASGTYGYCVDCRDVVDPMRLEFNPHAARCVRCEEKPDRQLRLPAF